MKATFWDSRYETNETVYGNEPNEFFKAFIDTHKPGTLLLPADNEGRNAIYAAKNGWQVAAFDFSAIAQRKALLRANEEKVHINYSIMDIQSYKALKQYDAIALIYVHVEQELRKSFIQK